MQLNPARLAQGEYVRTVHVATAEQGTAEEDLINPAYWAHVASKMRPWDRIEVRSDDGTFYAELLVLDSSRTWARVKLLKFLPLTSADVSQTQADDEYEIKFRGPVLRWSVVRRLDNAVIKEAMQNKDEAAAFLAQYQRTVGA